jgi:hypothetical protein
MKTAGKGLLRCGLFLLLAAVMLTNGAFAQGTLNVVAASNPTTPPPIAVAVGGQSSVTLSASVTNPPTAPYGCTLQTPTWTWQISSVQLNGAPAPNNSYSLLLSQSSMYSSYASLSCTFNQPGNWSVAATATVTYTDTCNDTWTGKGTVTVSFTANSGSISVSIGADGNYVGCGLDQVPINLTANTTPANLNGATYQWSIAAGPGNGTFQFPTQQTTPFTGSMEGDTTLQVSVGYNGEYATATRPATVIRIDVLTETVAPLLVNEVNVNLGSPYTINFSDPEYGLLRSVRIGPPIDSLYPYLWQQDYSGAVNHQSGDVSLTFNNPAPYFIQIIRDNGGVTNTQYQMLWVGGAAPGDGGIQVPQAQYDANKQPPDQGRDLICISSASNSNGAGDNLFDHNSRKKLPLAASPPDKTPNVFFVWNVVYDPKVEKPSVITAINAKWNNNGNNPFKMTIIGHGKAGRIETGGGTRAIQTKTLSFRNVALDASLDQDTKQFITACNGMVTDLYLYGCQVAQNDPKGLNGSQFLQDLATGGKMTVSAWDVCVTSWPVGSARAQEFHSTWGVVKGGNLVVKKP